MYYPADDDDDASNVVAIANGEATAAEKNAGAIVQTKVCHGYNQFNSLLTHQSSCSLQLSTYFYLRTIRYLTICTYNTINRSYIFNSQN